LAASEMACLKPAVHRNSVLRTYDIVSRFFSDDDVVVVAQNGGGYGRASRGGASDARYQPYSR